MKSTLLGLLLLTGCVNTVIQEQLLPAAAGAMPGVLYDYRAGLEYGVADGLLTEEQSKVYLEMADDLITAIGTRDPDVIALVPWADAMMPWALYGVDRATQDGTHSKGVASILRQRVDNFTFALEAVVTGQMPTEAGYNFYNPVRERVRTVEMY